VRSVERRRRLSLKSASALALLPTAGIVTFCLYVFIAWTAVISLTGSQLLPVYKFTGLDQYRHLFASTRWWTDIKNLALFTGLLIFGCLLLGYFLALLIDRGTRWRGFYRTVFLLPLSVSFVVTGLIWQWLLNPGLGIQHAVRALGWTSFSFNWIVRSDRSLYTLVIAGIWQQAGMCMALFLADLSRIDPNVWRIARVDGIPGWRTYYHIITPLLWPSFFSATILLFVSAVKAFDLVVTLTGGSPGFSSDLPARYVVDLINRHQFGMGAAGSCVLLGAVAAIVGPYIYCQLRKRDER